MPGWRRRHRNHDARNSLRSLISDIYRCKLSRMRPADGFFETVGFHFVFGEIRYVVILDMKLTFANVATMLSLRIISIRFYFV